VTDTVAIPIWLLVLLLSTGAWLTLERILVPGVRWVFQRKVNQAIEMMSIRHLLVEHDGRYRANPDEITLIE
jgi:hypothetical protein